MNNSYHKIKEDLYDLGVRKGDDILFYYYKEWLPEIEGGFKTLFDALLSSVGDSGTILISTGTYLNVNPDTPAGSPVFDVRNTPSCLDILPNEFLKLSGVERSLHPTHSVAALGARQSEYTRDHWKDNTPAGENSPYRKLFEFGAKYLFAEYAFSMNSTMHTIEEYMNLPYVLSDNTRHYVLIDKDGNRTEKDYYYHYMWQRGYGQNYAKLKSVMPYRIKSFLYTKAALIDSQQMWDAAVDAIKQDPYYFVNYESPNKTITISSLNDLLQSPSDSQKHKFPMNEQIKRYVEVNFDKEIKLQDIADCFGISLYYMMHQFKSDIGMSIVSYKNYCKLAKATELLMRTNQTIAEISEYCGFYSSSFFSMQFKKEMGISPSEYRKLMRVVAYKDHELFKGTNDKDVILFSQLPHFKLRSEKLILKNLSMVSNVSSKVLATSHEYNSPAVIFFRNQLFFAWNTILGSKTNLCIFSTSDFGSTLSSVHINCDSDKLCSPVFAVDNENLYLLASKTEHTGKIHGLDIFVYDEDTAQFTYVRSLNTQFKPNANVISYNNEKFILPGCCCLTVKDPTIPAVLVFQKIAEGDWKLVKLAESDRLPNGEKQIKPHCSLTSSGNTLYALVRNNTRKVPLLYQSHNGGETWDGAYSHDIPISEANHCSGTLTNGCSYIIGSLSPSKRNLSLFISNNEEFIFFKGNVILSQNNKNFEYTTSCSCENNNKIFVLTIASDGSTNQMILSTVNLEQL